jgi:hypothetical protein
MLQKALILMGVAWENGPCDAVIVSSPDVLHGRDFNKWKARVDKDKQVIPINAGWVDACLQSGKVSWGFLSHVVHEPAVPKRRTPRVEAEESDEDNVTMAALRFVYVHPEGFPVQTVRFMEKVLERNGANVYNVKDGNVSTGDPIRDTFLAVVIVRGATVKEGESFREIQKSLRGDYVVVSSAWLFMALQSSETLPMQWQV